MQEQFTPIITQLPSDVRMGVGSTPFEVKLSDQQFEAFIENLPKGSRNYYRNFCDMPNSVRVGLPAEYRNTFDLSDPKLTLEEMLAHSKHHNANTQSVALESLLRALA